jgi:hypothetical protein
MKRLLIALVIASLPAAPALAKKKKAPATSATTQKAKDTNTKLPPPNDKRTNEGAQGRMNATEAASQQADSPQFDHRP